MTALAVAEVLRAQSMTLQQWADMDEDQPGELVNGQLVEEEVPSHLHETIVRWLIRTLDTWGVAHGCPVFGSEHKLGISAKRGRKPDVCVYAPGTRFRNASISRTAPMLVVEVVSERPRDVKRDRHEKRAEYAAFGVKHYWLIDPEARVFEFLEFGSNAPLASGQTASDGKVEVSGFEGLVLDLDQLWSEVDAIIEFEEEAPATDIDEG
jgi:Uma2 family endonuclease